MSKFSANGEEITSYPAGAASRQCLQGCAGGIYGSIKDAGNSRGDTIAPKAGTGAADLTLTPEERNDPLCGAS